MEVETLGERLAEAETKGTVADMPVAVEVDTVEDKLFVVITEALVDTLAYRVNELDVPALCYKFAKVDAETLKYAASDRLLVVEENKVSNMPAKLIYTLTDRLPVADVEKVGNMPAKMECKAVLNTLSAREREVMVHTFGDTLSGLTGHRNVANIY